MSESSRCCINISAIVPEMGEPITITRKTTNLERDIFRKPTTTNTTINYFSNHPLEKKLAAYRYYIERMFKFPLSKEKQLNEWTTILDIARSNELIL